VSVAAELTKARDAEMQQRGFYWPTGWSQKRFTRRIDRVHV